MTKRGDYDHKKIEKKWRVWWAKRKVYRAKESRKPKSYILDMFPYPSGDGLHVGHPKGYIATDVVSRLHMMQGKNVLHPMGFDAFGLPAENFAIKNKIHPKKAVSRNIKRFKEQLNLLGFTYDWDRQVDTTEPKYYKWTQWIFLEMWKKGLAYESNEPINWCPSCKTGLANEDLEDGRCERCGSIVEKRPIRQWVLKIRDYADRLLSDLEGLNWPESIKDAQRNWIGRSEGAEIEFKVKSIESNVEETAVKVFTTRPDTLFGATYLVLAPEHPVVENLKDGVQNWEEVVRYIVQTKAKTEIERTAEGKEKTGVELKGIKAINPATKKEIPVWIADYVLAEYGTGAIMAVPAHDSRDFQFAKKFGLNIQCVISPIPAYVGISVKGEDSLEHTARETQEAIKQILAGERLYNGPGSLINSGPFDQRDNESAKNLITTYVEGRVAVNYKLRDWVFSRQRYWGEPIPLIHCEKCGVVPVPEKDLPVKLPEVRSYEPTGTGESPLTAIKKWVEVKCPACGGKGKRETNTMPQWAGSCWYYLRYMDPKNTKRLVDPKREKYWVPVDLYVGGAEHATRHLIYARFWHKFLYDIGVVSTREPFSRLQSVGLILASDGRKMSKRFGNVINPDDIVATYGADTLRVYEMFMGPFEQAISWSTENMIGARRFLERVWKLESRVQSSRSKKVMGKETEIVLHQTIKKVTEDIEGLRFNTAISALMILTNRLEKEDCIPLETFETLLKLLAPFAPHMTEELWQGIRKRTSIHGSPWPSFDSQKLESQTMKIVVQVNGKVRGTLEITRGTPEEEVTRRAMELPDVSKWLRGQIKKTIYVPQKLISFVVQS